MQPIPANCRFINELSQFINIDNLPPITAEHALQQRSMRNLLRSELKVCQAWQLCYFWTGELEFAPPMEVALEPRGIRRRHG